MSFKYKTILIVDDDAIDNYLVNVLIKTNNIAETILEFDNGEKAIEYLHNNKNNHDNLPEIILLDIFFQFESSDSITNSSKELKNSSASCS